jgi:hypothetical protein
MPASECAEGRDTIRVQAANGHAFLDQSDMMRVCTPRMKRHACQRLAAPTRCPLRKQIMQMRHLTFSCRINAMHLLFELMAVLEKK